MIKELRDELLHAFIIAMILFWGLMAMDISNRQSIWEEAYQNRVYTAPEPGWPKDVSGQPLGYGSPNIGLSQSSKYWRD